jgi:hypothetical protein
MKTALPRDMNPWCLVDHYEPAVSISRIEKDMKMEAAGSFETLVTIWHTTVCLTLNHMTPFLKSFSWLQSPLGHIISCSPHANSELSSHYFLNVFVPEQKTNALNLSAARLKAWNYVSVWFDEDRYRSAAFLSSSQLSALEQGNAVCTHLFVPLYMSVACRRAESSICRSFPSIRG